MKKALEWIYRIFMVTILQSLIVLVGFVSLHYGMEIFIELELLDWKVKAGFIQAALAITVLQIANLFYWIMDINIFNFKAITLSSRRTSK